MADQSDFKGRKLTKREKYVLVQNLDDFLLDEQNPILGTNYNRHDALAALDRLIKQDLISAETVANLRKNKAKFREIDQRPETEKSSAKQRLFSNFTKPSQNLLDLRAAQARKKPQTSKIKLLIGRWKQNKAEQKKIHQQQKAESKNYHRPDKITRPFSRPRLQLPTFKFQAFFVVKKLVIFALIVTVLLLPIRGLVMLAKLQNDQDKIWQLGKSGLVHLQSGALAAAGNDYQGSTDSFEQALMNFQSIQQVLGQYQDWLLKTGEHIPVVGKPLSLGQNLISVAENISQAGVILNTNLQKQSTVTEHISFIQGQIKKTLPYLEQAAEDIDGIKVSQLPDELRDYFIELETYLPTLTENLASLEQIFEVVLEILGENQEKRYLLLFQNNNELRATGGFIGSFAVVDLYQGKINNLEIPKGGTYDLEAGQTIKIKSPAALSLINPYFNIWDANWWSDFPTSARKIKWFYENFGGSSVDGIISINANVLKDLLAVTGPISLPDYGVSIDTNNVFTVLQEQVELKYDPTLNQPKAIIADLAPKLLEVLLNQPDKQKDIALVLAQQLYLKDIQIYLNNPEIQENVYQYGWSGSQLASKKDYLQVVSTNIGGGKTDNDIWQTIDHQAEILPSGEIINTVRVTRINQGPEDNILAGIDGSNVSYLRLYVPAGSQLISALGFDQFPSVYFQQVTPETQLDTDIEAEEDKLVNAASKTEIYSSLGKTVFANWVVLKPGETQTVLLKYKLPFKINIDNPTVNNWWEKIVTGDIHLDNYSLLVQSQSGDRQTVLNSSILLPDKLKVVWSKASVENKISVNDRLVTYTNELLGDQYFGFIATVK